MPRFACDLMRHLLPTGRLLRGGAGPDRGRRSTIEPPPGLVASPSAARSWPHHQSNLRQQLASLSPPIHPRPTLSARPLQSSRPPPTSHLVTPSHEGRQFKTLVLASRPSKPLPSPVLSPSSPPRLSHCRCRRRPRRKGSRPWSTERSSVSTRRCGSRRSVFL